MVATSSPCHFVGLESVVLTHTKINFFCRGYNVQAWPSAMVTKPGGLGNLK